MKTHAIVLMLLSAALSVLVAPAATADVCVDTNPSDYLSTESCPGTCEGCSWASVRSGNVCVSTYLGHYFGCGSN